MSYTGGVQDTMSLEQYKENLLGVRQAIPKMLELFQAFDIHATWATVGKLFFETKSQLLSNIPLLKPSYENLSFSGYHLISQMGDSEEEDPYYYAPSLIKKNFFSTSSGNWNPYFFPLLLFGSGANRSRI